MNSSKSISTKTTASTSQLPLQGPQLSVGVVYFFIIISMLVIYQKARSEQSTFFFSCLLKLEYLQLLLNLLDEAENFLHLLRVEEQFIASKLRIWLSASSLNTSSFLMIAPNILALHWLKQQDPHSDARISAVQRRAQHYGCFHNDIVWSELSPGPAPTAEDWSGQNRRSQCRSKWTMVRFVSGVKALFLKGVDQVLYQC